MRGTDTKRLCENALSPIDVPFMSEPSAGESIPALYGLEA